MTAVDDTGRMSPSAAGVADKPRIQRPGKFTCKATKSKGKDGPKAFEPEVAPSPAGAAAAPGW